MNNQGMNMNNNNMMGNQGMMNNYQSSNPNEQAKLNSLNNLF